MDFGSGNEMEFKVVVIGQARVGKTSLSYKFWAGEFDSDQKSSVNASHLVKTLHVSDGKPDVKLNIWDTAGQEKFHSLNHMYYRDANGALLVYDITDKDSFTKVREWVDELFKFAGEEVELIIAGNKYDLGKNRVVKEEDAVRQVLRDGRFASKIGATHFNTSAKTGKNVDELFNHMAKTLLKHREKNGTGGKRKPNNILNFKKTSKSKVCCK